MIAEHHLSVRKTARYCILGELGDATDDVWIVCHGFGQLAREFIAAFEPIAKPGRLIVAPEGLSRFYKSQGTVHKPDTPVGATWMTSEDRLSEITDYVGYLDTLLAEILAGVSPNAKLTVLGFSQGAATASRWVAAGGVSPVRVILWGGLLPPEFATNESLGGLRRTPLLLIIGDSDRYFTEKLIQAEESRLGKLEIEARIIRFAGEHLISPTLLDVLARE